MLDMIIDGYSEEAELILELQRNREIITKIDEEMASLFEHRMRISEEIADLKKELKLPVFDPEREAENLRKAESRVAPDLFIYYRRFLEHCMELSREYQERKS